MTTAIESERWGVADTRLRVLRWKNCSPHRDDDTEVIFDSAEAAKTARDILVSWTNKPLFVVFITKRIERVDEDDLHGDLSEW